MGLKKKDGTKMESTIQFFIDHTCFIKKLIQLKFVILSLFKVDVLYILIKLILNLIVFNAFSGETKSR